MPSTVDPDSKQSAGAERHLISTSGYWLLNAIRRSFNFAVSVDIESVTYMRVNEWHSLVYSDLLLKIEELT
jgi:hypothetical protein